MEESYRGSDRSAEKKLSSPWGTFGAAPQRPQNSLPLAFPNGASDTRQIAKDLSSHALTLTKVLASIAG